MTRLREAAWVHRNGLGHPVPQAPARIAAQGCCILDPVATTLLIVEKNNSAQAARSPAYHLASRVGCRCRTTFWVTPVVADDVHAVWLLRPVSASSHHMCFPIRF